MKYRITSIAFLLILSASCHNYYNEMVKWADEVPLGTTLDSVKQIQPDFLEIDWNQPEKIDSITMWYRISKIKNDHDAMKMENFLVFIGGKYQGRHPFK